MAKEKVYKLAKEFKVSSEALVQMLRGMGITGVYETRLSKSLSRNVLRLKSSMPGKSRR